MTEVPKPCPFCGGKPTQDHWAQKYMECKKCDTYGPNCEWPETAAEAWNRRADLSVAETPTPEQLKSACLSFRHDYGLMGESQKRDIEKEALDWWRCIARALSEGDAS